MILDTSFLLDLTRADPGAVDRAKQLEADGTPQRLAGITVYELYFGVGYTETPEKERRRVEALLDSRTIYEPTTEIMRKAGRLDGRLTREGSPIGDVADLLVAATGIVHDEPVLTRNAGHFERVDGVEMETY